MSGGADDDAHGNQTELEIALNQGNATWEITRYAGVEHGFTEWGGGGYSLTADSRSWDAMLSAFSELMPIPQMTSPEPTVTSGTLSVGVFVALFVAVFHVLST